MYTWILVFTVFLKNRNIISKIKGSKVTDYAALIICDKYQNIVCWLNTKLKKRNPFSIPYYSFFSFIYFNKHLIGDILYEE